MKYLIGGNELEEKIESFFEELFEEFNEDDRKLAKFIDIHQDIDKIVSDLIEKDVLSFPDD